MRLIAMVCLVFGCGRPTKPLTDEEREVASVEAAIAQISSPNVEQRRFGGQGVAYACCSFAEDEWRPARAVARPRACAALERVLVTEVDPRVLETPMHRYALGTCDVTLSSRLLLKRCEELPAGSAADSACDGLQIAEPTPEAVGALVAIAKKHVSDRQRTAFVIALAETGEQELISVVPLMSDPDPRIRDIGVETFSRALSRGPLELPGALQALDALSKDPDRALARFAEVTAEDYRTKSRERSESTVEDLLAHHLPANVRALALRRFSCKATNARLMLEQMAAGKGGDAVMARRALAMRAKRCGNRSARE